MSGTALILAAIGALLVPVSPAAAATPLYFVPADNTTHLVEHKCEVIGQDQYQNQAVHCADLYVWGSGDGQTYEVWGSSRIGCQQPSGARLQCAGIRATIGIYSHTVSGMPAPTSRTCGNRFGYPACPSAPIITNSPVKQSMRVPNDYWASSTNVTVVLPRSNMVVTDPNNLATQHWGLITKNSI